MINWSHKVCSLCNITYPFCGISSRNLDCNGLYCQCYFIVQERVERNSVVGKVLRRNFPEKFSFFCAFYLHFIGLHNFFLSSFTSCTRRVRHAFLFFCSISLCFVSFVDWMERINFIQRCFQLLYWANGCSNIQLCKTKYCTWFNIKFSHNKQLASWIFQWTEDSKPF